ncbi:MAG: 50S ribosomal protein L23 [Armatimonadetes bacterium]|nr:MAG: 50S ribosomal protein L23 [Armatimonadota bacterium]
MNIVVKKALITEKTMKLAKTGCYTFLVDRDARKITIAQAIENKFAVKVVSVRTANFKEVDRMQKNRRGHFSEAAFKKAVVVVKAGQRIALFETDEKKSEEKKEEIKEKKSLLRGTKVKIEKNTESEEEGKKDKK